MAKKDGETTSLAPKLRFPEFREAAGWRFVPLGQLLSRPPEYGLNAAAIPYSDDKPTYLRITDIDDDCQFIRDGKMSVGAEVEEDNYLSDGDIVLARTGASVGKSYRYREEDGRLVYAGFLIRVRPNPKQLSPLLLANYLTTKTYWDWVRINSARSGQPGINGTEYAELPIPIPASDGDEYGIAEQRKIAACLTSLDASIAARGRKLAALAAHKKGLMQQLFPRPGESLPRLRFPEFREEGEWETRPFSELCEIKHGYAFESEFFSSKGEYVLLTPGNFYEQGGYRDRGEQQKYYTGNIPQDYILARGDMLIAMTEQAVGLLGSPILVPQSDRFLHNQRLGLVTARPGVAWVTEFFFHLFNTDSIRNAIQSTASGTKVRHTSPTKVGDVTVSTPTSEAEQQRIVACLGSLDTALAAEAQALAALRTHKKGLMQQLFPSPEGD